MTLVLMTLTVGWGVGSNVMVSAVVKRFVSASAKRTETVRVPTVRPDKVHTFDMAYGSRAE